MGEGQRKHEGLGVHPPRAEDHLPADRDRQYEDIDKQQVGGKDPRCPPQVLLVDTFDDHHLELARQQQHREHREKRQRKPLRIAERGGATLAAEPQQRAKLRESLRPRPDIGNAVEQAPGHEGAHREKSDELNDRLEGNGRDHAFVPLGAVQMARAEHDRERREGQRDKEGAVLPPGDRRDHGRLQTVGEQVIAG